MVNAPWRRSTSVRLGGRKRERERERGCRPHPKQSKEQVHRQLAIWPRPTVLIKMIIQSYNYLPIGESLNFREVSNAGIFAFGRMLYLGSLIMLPVVGGMLLINLAGGIITRSAPTLNLFSFIFPITLIGVFIFLYLALGTIANAFSDLVGISINLIDNVLHSKEYK